MEAIPLLQVRGIAGPSRSSGAAEQTWWHSLDLDVRAGDIVLLRGPSGVGKSTLLKKIANLIPYDGRGDVDDDEAAAARPAEVRLRGSLPHEGSGSSAVNAANYRSRVLYVSQRPPTMQGSPQDFLDALMRLHVYDGGRSSTAVGRIQSGVTTAMRWATRKRRRLSVHTEAASIHARASNHGPGWRITDDDDGDKVSATTSVIEVDAALKHFTATGDAEQISRALGIQSILWTRPWGSLSGGEAQRMSLCIALVLAVRARDNSTLVMLLDEPTSALDDHTAQLVEQLAVLAKPLDSLALLWITHSDNQAVRVRALARAHAQPSRRVRTLHLGTGAEATV